jgi:transforming growth factor-beta-induced protein
VKIIFTFHLFTNVGRTPPHEKLFALFQEPENQLRRTKKGKKGRSPVPSTLRSPVTSTLQAPVTSTLFQIVAATPSLSTLGIAVIRAGLVGILNSNDFNLTVFAPNNAAFNAVPTDLANTLFFNDAFLPHLIDLLIYHILATDLPANARGIKGNSLLALNGESLAVTQNPSRINGNLIIARDIVASNGIANIIDGVLLPSWVSNCITDRVAAASDLSTLLALVNLVPGLGDALADPKVEYTLVAPVNSAFAKLSKKTVDFLTSPAGIPTLKAILLYHVFPDILVSSELTHGLVINTLEAGKKVKVSVTNAGIFLNGKSKVIEANILANNGVVHKIDTVLDLKDGR